MDINLTANVNVNKVIKLDDQATQLLQTQHEEVMAAIQRLETKTDQVLAFVAKPRVTLTWGPVTEQKGS